MIAAIALAAAVAYGAADFLGGLASRRTDTFAVVVWSQLAGLGCLIAAVVLMPATVTRADLGWGAACGFAGSAAVLLLYRGLAVGVMSVVSPITAVLAAIIPVIWSLARGAVLTPLAFGGIACGLVAVALVSAPGDDGTRVAPRPLRRLPPGIVEAIGAGIAFGFFFIAIARAGTEAGLQPLLAARFVSLTLLALTALTLRRPLSVSRPALPTVVGSGVLDMLANVLYVLAAQRGQLAVVAVLTSLYPASTVALAAAVLRERMAPVQWAGVGLAIAGVVALAT